MWGHLIIDTVRNFSIKYSVHMDLKIIITYITLCALLLLPDKETNKWNSYVGVFNYISINKKCFKFELEFSPKYIYANLNKSFT